MAREKVEFDVIGRDAGGSKVFKEVGDAADKAGEKVDGVGEKFHGLDAEIEQTRTHMRNLAKEIDETGNKDLFKDLRKQQSELRRLMSVKNLLGDGKDNDTLKTGVKVGERLADGVAAGLTKSTGVVSNALGGVFGGLPPQAQAAIGAGIVTAVAATGPLVGATIAGAVVGAAGIGGVAGGIALAARDPKVKAAAADLGDEFLQAMTRASAKFVPVTIDALDRIRSEVRLLEDDFTSVFGDAAQFVEPLTDGIIGAVRAFLPGLSDAIRAAGPVIDVISAGLVRIGSATGDLFSTMAKHASEGADALKILFFVVESGIHSIDILVGTLSTLYRWLDITGSLLTGNTEELMRLRIEAENTGTVIGRRVGDMDNMARKSKDAAGGIRELTESYGEMMTRFAGENLSAREAQRGLEEAIDRATGALKENGRTLDINTPKGRANQEALDSIAEAANRTYASTLRQTGSQVAATEAAQLGREEFVRLAQKMGLSRTAAEKLAGTLIGIPSDTKADVKSNAKTVAEQAAAVDRKLRDIENGSPYNAQVNVRFTEKGDRFGISGKAFKGQSHGGRVEGPGTDTSDDIIRRVSRGEYIIRAAAARAIGYDTLDALNQADRRPVAMTSAGPSAASAGPAHGITAEDFYRAMVRAIQTLPIVRLDAGRTAGIYARGG